MGSFFCLQIFDKTYQGAHRTHLQWVLLLLLLGYYLLMKFDLKEADTKDVPIPGNISCFRNSSLS